MSPEALQEAKRWLSGLHLRKINVLYLYGVGLGYDYAVLKKWLKSNAYHRIVFFEDDPEAVSALSKTELGKELTADPQAELIVFDSKTLREQVEQVVERYAALPFKVSGHRRYLKERTAVLKEINRIISLSSKEKLILSRIGRLAGGAHQRNVLFNLLYLPGRHLAGTLFGSFKGVPALIVGAGPSLEKNIEVLRGLKDRALIIAGGKAVNALSRAGIVPHFIVLTDPTDRALLYQMSHYAYQAPVFFLFSSNFKALNRAYGEKLLFATESRGRLEEWIFEELGIDPQPLHCMQNSASASLAIAAALGCERIATVGMDLAFTEESPFAPLTPEHPLFAGWLGYRPKEMREELIGRKDIHGEVVTTLMKWLQLSSWFSKFALRHPEITLLNATEGGIGFPGIENLPLQKAADRYMKERFDLEEKIRKGMEKGAALKNAGQLLETLLGSLETSAELIARLQEKFEGFSRRAAEGEELPEKFIDEEVTRILLSLEEEPGYDALLREAASILNSLFQMEFEQLENEAPLLSGKERQLRQLELHRAKFRILEEAVKSAGKLVGEAVEAAEEFDFSDKMKPSLSFSEGLLEGEQSVSYPSGAPFLIVSFKKGKKEGKEFFRFPDGKKMIEAEYCGGEPCCRARFWDEKGRLRKEVLYSAPGEVEKIKAWDEEGGSFTLPPLKAAGPYGRMADNLYSITDSLESVCRKVEETLPENEELEEIKEEIAGLKELNKKIAGKSAGAKEQIWITPKTGAMAGKLFHKEAGQFLERFKQAHHLLDRLQEKLRGQQGE